MPCVETRKMYCLSTRHLPYVASIIFLRHSLTALLLVTRGSLLFVGDSLSLQMFWALLHLVPADGGELSRARRLYDMDFKRGGEFSLCDGASRVAFVRNDWLVEHHSGIAPATSTRPTT